MMNGILLLHHLSRDNGVMLLMSNEVDAIVVDDVVIDPPLQVLLLESFQSLTFFPSRPMIPSVPFLTYLHSPFVAVIVVDDQ
jgi:hypothetical protein